MFKREKMYVKIIIYLARPFFIVFLITFSSFEVNIFAMS